MSNEAATDATAEETAMAEADNLMWGRDADAEDAPAADPGVDPDDPDSEPEAVEDGAPAEEEAPEPEPSEEGEPEPEEETPRALAHAQIRRQRRQVKRYQDELEQRQNKFRADQDAFEASRRAFQTERDTHFEQMRTDPEAAFSRFAKQAGMTPDDFFQRVTERRIGEGPGSNELVGRMAQLEAELKRRDAADVTRREDAEAQQRTQARGNGIASNVQTVVSELASNPDVAAKLPHLAAMEPAERQRRLMGAMNHATDNKLDLTLFEVAEAIDLDAAKRYAHMQQGLGHPASSDEKPAGQAAPASRAKPGAGQRRRTVSNTDSAQSGGTRREQTEEERLLDADADIKGWSRDQTY